MKSINFKDLKSPLFIAWQINSVCNLECLHCCEEAGQSIPGEMNREEIFNFLKQVVNLHIPYVALSGGEPLLHPYFFSICEFLRKDNISLKVETNGEFIDEEKAKKIAQLRFRSVQVSLDGATAYSHERLRLRGNWNKVVSSLRILIKEGVNTEIVFVPTKFNIGEIGQLIDLAYSLGVYGVYTGKIMRIGRAAQNWEILCPSEKDYEYFFKSLNEKIAHYDGRMKVYYYPYDVLEELKYRLKFPAASLLVLPNGKVKLIGPLPFICGDLKKDTLEQVWENYKKAWQNPKVIKFAKEVIAQPRLLAEANRWREI
ncbi:MAG: radical SAM protein [Candidatus Omnitrophica bacterium]|nr:radical SAM protein [Candidatus Omnitrophota bacterium]